MKKTMMAVVLAAGKSTRMKSDYSKVAHKILGKEVVNFLLDALVESGIDERDIVLVVDPENHLIKQAIQRDVQYAIQDKPRGTAHALLSAKELIKNFAGDLIVAVGDNPYITSTEIKKLIQHHQEFRSSCTLLSALFPQKLPPYGRIIRDQKNKVIGVVEEMDASEDQLKIREVNSSIYLFDNKVVFPLLTRIKNNNRKKEYYLTDIIHILQKNNHSISAVIADDFSASIGINTRWDIQEAEKKLNERNQKILALEKGVTILQPETVTIECNVEIGRDSIIFPCTYIASGTRIGRNCQIGPFAYLKKITVEDGSKISFEKRLVEDEN